MHNIKRNNTYPIYTLEVASELSGTATHSIRQYVDRGLIIPYKKKNNRQLFSEADIGRLRWIRKLIDEQGLNVAGIKAVYSLIPCWNIKQCSEEDRTHCDAYHSSTQSCWEASCKGSNCKKINCRVCPVYRIPENFQDVKTLLKELY